MEEQIVLPKTMVAIIEKQQECIEVLKKEIRFLKRELMHSIKDVERSENRSNIWRTIADDLVYTEHDDYSHLHTRKEDPCVRCAAHNAYHEQVNREDNQ
jgi:hypothetical protein